MSLLDSYTYDVEVEWTGGRSGVMDAPERPDLEVSAPPEFSGEPGKWTPEHLLVAATASCLMTTYAAIAALMKLEVLGWRAQATARLEKIQGEGYRFTEITLAPEIEVAEADLEKAAKVMAKAEKNCFISNSLKAVVQVEPRFLVAQAEQVR